MKINSRRIAMCVAAITATMGCGDPTGKGPPPQPGNPSITASVLTAGGEGMLQGTHLDKLAGTVSVDGVAVTPTSRSQTEIRFPMPPARPCEVDGRPVSVQAGTLAHTGQLEVAGALALQVGESRVLTREQMASLCLQLPAGSESYVLTALNPSLEPAPAPDALFTVRSWTGNGNDASAALVRAEAAESPSFSPEMRSPRFALSAATHHYSENPEPFDPRYATAGVGDTLPWVDWWGRQPNCGQSREVIPTINIVIAAVSASGKTVFAYDARSSHGPRWSSATVRARLTRAAEIMERWAVPAVREVMGREYQPLKGAGGRWFHVFRTDVPGWTIDNNDAPQTACRFSSEVPSTISPDSPPEFDAQVEYLAGLLIHEYGHHAESVYRIRRWGSATPPVRVSTGWSGLGEVWAQTVQETAARLASGQPTAARYAPLDAANSNIPYADFYLNGYGESPGQSLWGITVDNRGGYYDQGTRFVMYLRERWGDAAIGSTRERFFERVQEQPHYGVPSMAALAGLSATAALDEWSLAEATDDLVAAAAAAARGLPQIQSWTPGDAGPLPSARIHRTVDAVRRLSAGSGNYAALYLYADGSDAGRGISLTFGEFGAVPVVARITRLR